MTVNKKTGVVHNFFESKFGILDHVFIGGGLEWYLSELLQTKLDIYQT